MTEKPPNKRPGRTARQRRKVQRDRVGNLFVEIPDESGTPKLHIEFKRSWYSPPLTGDGEVDLECAAKELSEEWTGGTLVIARYLESGDLGYKTEITLESKDELELVIRTMRKLYVDGLKRDNEVRRAALDTCRSRLAEPIEPERPAVDRRRGLDRRTGERRGRRLLSRLWFRTEDRRSEEDRRSGRDRRAA